MSWLGDCNLSRGEMSRGKISWAGGLQSEQSQMSWLGDFNLSRDKMSWAGGLQYEQR